MIVCAIDGRFPQKRRVEKFIDDVVNHFFPKDLKKNVLIITNMRTNLGDDAGQCCNAGRRPVGFFCYEICSSYLGGTF